MSETALNLGGSARAASNAAARIGRAPGSAGRGEDEVGQAAFLRPLPGWIWFAAILAAGWGLLTANGVLTSYAVLLLPVLAALLWFPGEPPALLFACFMQWVQASMAVFYTNVYGVPLSYQTEYGGADLVTATWLSLTGVLVLALGMRLALWRQPVRVPEETLRDSLRVEPGRVFLWYLVAFACFGLVGWVGNRIPGLAQPLRALATLKWVLVFLLAHGVLTQRRGYSLLAIVAFLEFATGILGFFSDFKNIFFLLLVALPASPFLFYGWRKVNFGLVTALVLAVGVVWTAIKQDYREFLNQGTGAQAALVPVPDRAAKLVQLVGSLDGEKVRDGLEQLVLRVSYVSFFAWTLGNVPDAIPFERGKLWRESIEHVLMPRLFFPNKAAIHDSDRVNYYSGVQVATPEQGASISLGYMTESYIDFGPVGMFVPILLLGVFYGFIYRFFAWRYRLRLLGVAMGTAILIFGAYTIETSNIKLIGGNLMSLLVMGAFAKLAGSWFWGRLVRTESSTPVATPSPNTRGARRGRTGLP
jgi:hypothetical protein